MHGAGDPAPSVRAFYTGKSGSGKTARMVRDVLSVAPRVLVADQTGEWAGRPSANGAPIVEAIDLDETIAALQSVAHRRDWWIVATLDRDELESLAARLIPAGRVRSGPAAKLGGLALCLDEVDRVIGHSASPLRDLWRRGRHAGVSVIAATQRPGNVSKEVTAQCDAIAVLALHEPADADYLRSLMGRENADRALAWANGGAYRVAYYFPATGTLTLADPAPSG